MSKSEGKLSNTARFKGAASPPRAVFTLNRVIYGQRRSFLFQLTVHLPVLSRAFHF